jgi:hypothetical protein
MTVRGPISSAAGHSAEPLLAHQFVFVGGLHRSGTSLLTRCLGGHPLVSGFRDTGVPEDEGQHLQTVYRPASAYGGPGRFAFDPDSYLTEESELATEASRHRLLAEWGRHWDLGRPVLVEKSPPNLVRSRFLQALFPAASFVVVLRHPLPVAFATQKWSGTSTASLVEHWLVAHERFELDRPHLHRLYVVRYEELVERPRATLDAVFAFLGLEPAGSIPEIRPDVNAEYLQRWRDYANGASTEHRDEKRRIVSEYGQRLEAFGYRLTP